MSNVEVGREIPRPVGEWIDENLDFIARKLEEQRRALLKRHRVPPSSLSLNERWLSEMPLCEVWGKIRKGVSLPTGFKVGVTEVFVANGEFPLWEREHFCAFGRGEEILCITPGQFVKAGGRVFRFGERTEVLLEKAPELISIYPGGVVALYGKEDIIGSKLGIWY